MNLNTEKNIYNLEITKEGFDNYENMISINSKVDSEDRFYASISYESFELLVENDRPILR